MIGKGTKIQNLINAVPLTFIFTPIPTVHAAIWENSFTLPLTYEYQTNPTLVSTDEQPISKVVISPAYNVKVSQDLNTWTANLLYKIERSSENANSQDREYPSLNLGWSRSLENGQMGVTALYDDNSTRETEFDDSGQVLADGSRKLGAVSANWSHSLNEKTSFSMNAGYSQIKYSNINLIDYSSSSLATSINYLLNDKIEPFITLSTSKTDRQNSEEITYVQSLIVGTLYSATNKLNFTVSGSVNKVKTATERTTKSASFLASYTTEYTQSNISLSRSLAASGSVASVIESDQLKASWNYIVSESNNLTLNVNARNNKDLSKNKTLIYGISYTGKLSTLWGWRLFAQRRNLSNSNMTTDVNNDIAGISLILKTN